jgi:transcriptional regulator with XRE-family HTH domain
LRNEKKLNQAVLSEALGISQAMFSKFEKDESTLSVEQVKIIAKVLKTTVSYLIEGKADYEMPQGMMLVSSEDVAKYERFLRVEAEAEVEKLKNIAVFSESR